MNTRKSYCLKVVLIPCLMITLSLFLILFVSYAQEPGKSPIELPEVSSFECDSKTDECHCYSKIDCKVMKRAGVCEEGTYEKNPDEELYYLIGKCNWQWKN